MSAAEIIAELPRLSPAELAQVEAKLKELSQPSQPANATPAAAHPALGVWKDRTDLPADPVEAAKLLSEHMLQRLWQTSALNSGGDRLTRNQLHERG